jgi:hypothetical protein
VAFVARRERGNHNRTHNSVLARYQAFDRHIYLFLPIATVWDSSLCVRIVSLRQYRRGRYYLVSMHRDYILFSCHLTCSKDSQASSQSSHISPSESEEKELAPTNSSSKRRATLPPAGSLRPQKSARTDLSHGPRMAVRQSGPTSRMRDASDSDTGIALPIARKKRKVLLPRNREMHSSAKVKFGSGTSTT